MEGHRIPDKIEPISKEWFNTGSICKIPPELKDINLKINERRNSMLKKYEFEINECSLLDRVFKVNKHNVQSGVFTMLYYKVLNNDNYKVDHKMKHEFSKGEYFHKQINTSFVLKEA